MWRWCLTPEPREGAGSTGHHWFMRHVLDQCGGDSSTCHPIVCRSAKSGAGPEEEGGARQVSEYCKDQLTRGREELSVEELRAERYFLQRQRNVEERLKTLTEMKEQLSHELEEKRKLLLLKESQQVLHAAASRPSAASSILIDDESQSTAARPAGNSELLNEFFLQPDDTGLSLKIRVQRPDCPGGTTGDHLLVDPHHSSVPQEPGSYTTNKLSPIQETSVEAVAWSLLEDQRQDKNQNQDQIQGQDQNQEEVEPDHAMRGGAVDACDPEARQQLLDICDVTSSPGFHCESRPLPPVNSCLQLGGDLYHIYCRVVDEEMFSIYKGATNDDNVLVKVSRCRVPWDFHQFRRLKENSSVDSFPQISCFLFLDGCITVYTCPPDHMFTELTECEDSVVRKSLLLLQLVSELHSRHLLHAALRPSILVASYRGLNLERVFPVDWSSSVDVDMQQDVTSVQQLSSAHSYIRVGLLEPTSPPQLVDLLGVAETVHLLLTSSRMVLVKDHDGWTAERFSQDESCNMCPGTWTTWSRFFRSLLNASGRCSMSVLSDVTEQLSLLLK
ncbi:mitotic checkpoint serine/threonine-protein kinase BUB1 beta isoform X2 [Platichthys flesus]|uniref:mitotic checkpoint serine/threonine-protein kinase BUB1 beta isoform X2 n=1 Tax=Platichthys flesus TaxID=8260 RepID=UPI002DB55799|nr:mitotic checkpoint serine/threonine-protein kinase BUB1 beta isoform X2 [Platichthys flesus]